MTKKMIDPYYQMEWADYTLKKRLRFRLEALGSRVALAILRLLGAKTSKKFLQSLFGFVGPHFSLSQMMCQNIQKALNLEEEQAQKITKEAWENFGRIIGGYPFIQDFDSLDPAQLQLKGWDEYFLKAKKENRPIILFSAHIGNWELISKIAEDRGEVLHRIFKPPSNPLVYNLFRDIRVDETSKEYLHPSSQRSVVKVIKALKQGGTLAILTDQKYSEGHMVPFFHQKTPTNTLLAALAIKTDAIILPCHSYWDENGNFIAEVDPPLSYQKGQNMKESQYEILYAMNQHIEKWVRAHPGQWFWHHKRWK